MNRKKFFHNLIGLVGVAASSKELASLQPMLPPPADNDRPGIGGESFTLQLDRNFFGLHDIIVMDSMFPEYWREWRVVERNEDYDVIENIETRDRARITDFYPVGTRKLCSCIGEYQEV